MVMPTGQVTSVLEPPPVGDDHLPSMTLLGEALTALA
jgi:hypothetical protein